MIIKSIDSLGHNYKEWQDITKIILSDIYVIDFQPLDTKVEGKSVVDQFIFDIFLQILSFVVQNEREKIRKCKTDGIRIEKKYIWDVLNINCLITLKISLISFLIKKLLMLESQI